MFILHTPHSERYNEISFFLNYGISHLLYMSYYLYYSSIKFCKNLHFYKPIIWV